MLAVLGGTGFLIQSGFLRHEMIKHTKPTTHQVIPSLAHPNPPKPLRLLARSAETPSLQELHSHNLPTGHFTVTISRQVVMSRPNTMREMIKTSHQVIPSLARPNPPKPLRLLARSAETPSLQDTSGDTVVLQRGEGGGDALIVYRWPRCRWPRCQNMRTLIVCGIMFLCGFVS
jgi:hypothetical protein